VRWPNIADVREAVVRLAGLSHRTPLVPSLTAGTARDVRLKLESVQDTRSFKIRGAGNAVLARADEGFDGVVTYSTGNHGRATAHVAARLGLPSVVCVSTNTTEDKRRALEAVGADVRVVGQSQDEAAAEAERLAANGLLLVDPINDPLVTAGHGTIGLELLEQWPALDTVVVPVSGGALISGIALVMKGLGADVRVVGVSMERGASMVESRRAGRPVVVEEAESLADSLQGGITLHNTHTFDMVGDLVDELVTVSEEEIARAMVNALAGERLVLEGAAATTLAAVGAGRVALGERVALIATGAMVDVATLTGLVTDRLDAGTR
jgi:threonine dehydratase